MLYSGIAAVFLLGGVAGGMVGVMLERERLKRIESGPPAMLMEVVSRRLERELNLDEEQTRKVRTVYAESRPEVVEAEMEHRRRMGEIMRATHAKVEAVLRPDQLRAFNDLKQRVEHRLRMREATGPGGGKGKGGWKGPPGHWRGPDGLPPRGEGRHEWEKRNDPNRPAETPPPPEPGAEEPPPAPPENPPEPPAESPGL